MSRLSQCVITEDWKEEEEDENEEFRKFSLPTVSTAAEGAMEAGIVDEEEEKGGSDEYVIKSGNPAMMNKSSRYPLFRVALQKSPTRKIERSKRAIRERNNSTGTVLVKNAIQEPNISNLIDW